MNIHAIFIVKDPNVAKQLSSYLLYKYVVVPADKAPNNNVFPWVATRTLLTVTEYLCHK
jgi:hypothetical protein